MNTRADKTQENRSQSVADSVSHKQSRGESTFQFVDNRPESIAQRKLTERANNSPQVSRLRDFQRMANNSPQAKHAAQLQARANNYSALQQQLIQKTENKTGLPDNLKSGIETLSNYWMGDVKAHHNSDRPAQLMSPAHAQETDIKENDNQLRDNNLDINGDRLKTGIENNSESAVVQAKLYVIGEMHPDTDLRLEQEKEFCEEKFGAGFYPENEYKLPGTEITADSKALKGLREAMIPFYYTPDFLKKSVSMSAKQLDENAEFISDYIDLARLEFEELQRNPDPRFQFEDERLKTIMPKLEELDVALTDLRANLNPKETAPGEGLKKINLINDIEEKYDDLRGSITVLHKITLSHGKRMRRELDKSRSTGMAKALIATGEKAKGVWKVGDDHIPEIRETLVEKDQEQLLPQVISEDAFNTVFLKWFESKYKVKYDEYLEERENL